MKKIIAVTSLICLSFSTFSREKMDNSHCLNVLNNRVASTYNLDAQESIESLASNKFNKRERQRYEKFVEREVKHLPSSIKFEEKNNRIEMKVTSFTGDYHIEEDDIGTYLYTDDLEIQMKLNADGLVDSLYFSYNDEKDAVVVTNIEYINNVCKVANQEVVKYTPRGLKVDNWERTYIESECRDLEKIDQALSKVEKLKSRFKKNRADLAKYLNDDQVYAPKANQLGKYNKISLESIKVVKEYKKFVNYSQLSEDDLVAYIDDHSKSIDNLFKRDSRLDLIDRFTSIHNVYKKYQSEVTSKLDYATGKINLTLNYSTYNDYGYSELINDNFLSSDTQKLLNDYKTDVLNTCRYIER